MTNKKNLMRICIMIYLLIAGAFIIAVLFRITSLIAYLVPIFGVLAVLNILFSFVLLALLLNEFENLNCVKCKKDNHENNLEKDWDCYCGAIDGNRKE